MTDIKEAVRKRYATAALQVRETGSCCGPDPAASDGLGAELYAALETEGLPDTARLASLGCGNPTAVASLGMGEVVLDLGSGGGLDVFLSARRVGPTGRVYGLDMTDEMLDLARRNQAEAGINNVEFLKGEIEAIPLPDHSIDVIISNCVINLSVDKSAVFREAYRVLKSGGRFAVTDIVTTRRFTEEEQSDLAAWTGCIAGALYQDDFVTGLEQAGFHDVEMEVTHQVAPDAVSAIVRAVA
jgi:ubiquinone/menaquinone biosynthesis C-methylase UbiE